MSLVDYASSSEDEEVGEDEELQHFEAVKRENRQAVKAGPDDSVVTVSAPPQTFSHSTSHHRDADRPSNARSMEKLPDASILLSSPSFLMQQFANTDQSFRISSTIFESVSRKREPNGSAFVHQRSKNPRGNLPHLRNVPDTVSGTLIPPQLKGRSNVVTEDISKLFVNRHQQPSE